MSQSPSSNQDLTFSSDTGTPASGDAWLDAHFKAFQSEYEHALRVVGLRPGWRVLDAGCGPGGYLPLLSELLGARGRVDALDHSAGHIDTVKQRVAQHKFAAVVHAQQGDMLDLPFPDNTFDAVWCANTLQYFSDEALTVVLHELVRVTKPGGLVAIKDYDSRSRVWSPAHPALTLNYLSQLSKHPEIHPFGSVRTADLGAWLYQAGVMSVRQVHVPMVRSHPLTPHAHRFVCDLIKYISNQAAALGLSDADCALWQKMADEDAPDHFFHDPSFTYREVQIVFVGHKPGEANA